MLEMLLIHLSKIATKSDKNLMTVSNLGVCFGPTLLRQEEETVAAIMDIKFANVVVEILISNWHTLLKTKPDTNPPPKPSHSKSQTVTPVKTSPTVKPPPYVPPPPPGSSVSPPAPSAAPPTLVQTVIFDGPKMQAAVTPGPQVPVVNNNGGPGYATWERTLRGSTPGQGPGQPPGPGSVTGGQPSVSSRGLSSVSSSLSNLSSVSTPTGMMSADDVFSVHSNIVRVLCPGVPWPRPAQRTVLLHNRQQSASHLRDTGHVTGPRDSVGARDSGLLSGYDTSTTARSSRGSRSSSSSTDSLASWSSKETHTSNNTGISAVSHHSHSVPGQKYDERKLHLNFVFS